MIGKVRGKTITGGILSEDKEGTGSDAAEGEGRQLCVNNSLPEVTAVEKAKVESRKLDKEEPTKTQPYLSCASRKGLKLQNQTRFMYRTALGY